MPTRQLASTGGAAQLASSSLHQPRTPATAGCSQVFNVSEPLDTQTVPKLSMCITALILTIGRRSSKTSAKLR